MHLPESNTIVQQVRIALEEDIGSGDITASLLPKNLCVQARIVSHETAVLCGQAWATETFHQVDSTLKVDWLSQEGDHIQAGQKLCQISGSAGALLTAERTALNFLQTLSGTATTTAEYQKKIAHTSVKLLDTRKTLPGFRAAQKYAVRCGGGHNHRMGLYDAFLIKENHIMVAGGIAQAIHQARQLAPDKTLEVEVETLTELQTALQAKPDIIMLDNFDLPALRQAVQLNSGAIKLEASGGFDHQHIVQVAETGVDYISVGALTKHIRAIDLSMRIQI